LARRLAVAAALAVGVVPGAAAQAAVSPQQLVKALLVAPSPASLPSALRPSFTRRDPLTAGARQHHAVGAVFTGNDTAIVGFLVFPTHALAVADLKAFPPNRGPNRIVTARPAGFDPPAYILRADAHGYTAAYAVFVHDNVLINAWTYGPRGSQTKLYRIVLENARWAKNRSTRLARGS
jgi:hypothetical protein